MDVVGHSVIPLDGSEREPAKVLSLQAYELFRGTEATAQNTASLAKFPLPPFVCEDSVIHFPACDQDMVPISNRSKDGQQKNIYSY